MSENERCERCDLPTMPRPQAHRSTQTGACMHACMHACVRVPLIADTAQSRAVASRVRGDCCAHTPALIAELNGRARHARWLSSAAFYRCYYGRRGKRASQRQCVSALMCERMCASATGRARVRVCDEMSPVNSLSSVHTASGGGVAWRCFAVCMTCDSC